MINASTPATWRANCTRVKTIPRALELSYFMKEWASFQNFGSHQVIEFKILECYIPHLNDKPNTQRLHGDLSKQP